MVTLYQAEQYCLTGKIMQVVIFSPYCYGKIGDLTSGYGNENNCGFEVNIGRIHPIRALPSELYDVTNVIAYCKSIGIDVRSNVDPLKYKSYFDLMDEIVEHEIIERKYVKELIKDVNIIVPNKVVEVTFNDGTKQKAVCKEPDVFSLEQAISICLCKRMIGGSGVYNKAVKSGMKVYENKLAKEAEKKEEQERIAKKRTKRIAYKKRRDAKKEQIEKERQIEIQKEAYIRAMNEVNKIIR